MSHKGFDEIEPGTTNWGATEKQIKRDIIDTLVGDCLDQVYRELGHRHTKLYSLYPEISNPILSCGSNTIDIGNVDNQLSNFTIFMDSSIGELFVCRGGNYDDVMFKIDMANNVIDIGNGTTTVNVNGTPLA